jgi:hypothetical protein
VALEGSSRMSISLPGRASAPGRLRSPSVRPLPRPVRRVRHEVRDGVAVMVFSAAASTALAGAMLLLVTLAG